MLSGFSPRERKEIFLAIFGNQSGHIGNTCIAAGINRRTYHQWIADDQEFADKCFDVQEALLDTAESKLHENINGNQIQAITFFLKTKGKSRGYVERQEISGPGGKPLEILNSITINLAVLTTTELEHLQSISKKLIEAEGVDDGSPDKEPAKLIPFGNPAELAIRSG